MDHFWGISLETQLVSTPPVAALSVPHGWVHLLFTSLVPRMERAMFLGSETQIKGPGMLTYTHPSMSKNGGTSVKTLDLDLTIQGRKP
jgi:hypothetical protein